MFQICYGENSAVKCFGCKCSARSKCYQCSGPLAELKRLDSFNLKTQEHLDPYVICSVLYLLSSKFKNNLEISDSSIWQQDEYYRLVHDRFDAVCKDLMSIWRGDITKVQRGAYEIMVDTDIRLCSFCVLLENCDSVATLSSLLETIIQLWRFKKNFSKLGLNDQNKFFDLSSSCPSFYYNDKSSDTAEVIVTTSGLDYFLSLVWIRLIKMENSAKQIDRYLPLLYLNVANEEELPVWTKLEMQRLATAWKSMNLDARIVEEDSFMEKFDYFVRLRPFRISCDTACKHLLPLFWKHFNCDVPIWNATKISNLKELCIQKELYACNEYPITFEHLQNRLLLQSRYGHRVNHLVEACIKGVGLAGALFERFDIPSNRCQYEKLAGKRDEIDLYCSDEDDGNTFEVEEIRQSQDICTMGSTCFCDFPNEILVIIFGQLRIEDLVSFSRTSKCHYHLMNLVYLYKDYAEKIFMKPNSYYTPPRLDEWNWKLGGCPSAFIVSTFNLQVSCLNVLYQSKTPLITDHIRALLESPVFISGILSKDIFVPTGVKLELLKYALSKGLSINYQLLLPTLKTEASDYVTVLEEIIDSVPLVLQDDVLLTSKYMNILDTTQYNIKSTTTLSDCQAQLGAFCGRLVSFDHLASAKVHLAAIFLGHFSHFSWEKHLLLIENSFKAEKFADDKTVYLLLCGLFSRYASRSSCQRFETLLCSLPYKIFHSKPVTLFLSRNRMLFPNLQRVPLTNHFVRPVFGTNLMNRPHTINEVIIY